MKKIKLIFTSSRPLSWVNTAFPFAASYLYFTHSVDATFIVGTLFFLIPYNLLMYGINDVYDYESDLKNPRKGGIEGAIIPKKYHKLILLWSYLLPIPFFTWLAILQPASIPVLLATIFFVIAYSAKGLRFKEIPILDSVTSSLHFVGPLIYALSIVGWPTQAWPIVIAFFIWGIASQSLGAIQDIVYDKKAGIKSIGTVMGERKTLYFAYTSYILALCILIPLGLYGLVVAVAGLAYVANVFPAVIKTTDAHSEARKAWKRFLWINYIVGAVVTIVLLMLTLHSQ